MHRVKLRAVKLWKDVALLAWAFVLAFVLSLILFGAMLAAAYVADEFYTERPPHFREARASARN